MWRVKTWGISWEGGYQSTKVFSAQGKTNYRGLNFGSQPRTHWKSSRQAKDWNSPWRTDKTSQLSICYFYYVYTSAVENCCWEQNPPLVIPSDSHQKPGAACPIKEASCSDTMLKTYCEVTEASYRKFKIRSGQDHRDGNRRLQLNY